MKTSYLRLKGMGCASCANTIETAIQNEDGVGICHVNFGAEQATVEFDPD